MLPLRPKLIPAIHAVSKELGEVLVTQGPETKREGLRSDALQSWKEIAAYLKRGIRTAQRWERDAGLPVRRARPGDRSPVFAFPSEIDAWLHSRPTRFK